jgi:hypothetical protein
MQNGEMLRNRWSIAMYGVALNGEIHLSSNLTEAANLVGLGLILTMGDVKEIVYAATREFDEMIAKGRFTNARRAHEAQPFYTPVPGAAELPWRCLGGKFSDEVIALRGPDLPSKGIAEHIEHNWDDVAVHLMRDVVSLILMERQSDLICQDWCEHVLSDFDFAHEQIMGGE